MGLPAVLALAAAVTLWLWRDRLDAEIEGVASSEPPSPDDERDNVVKVRKKPREKDLASPAESKRTGRPAKKRKKNKRSS